MRNTLFKTVRVMEVDELVKGTFVSNGINSEGAQTIHPAFLA